MYIALKLYTCAPKVLLLFGCAADLIFRKRYHMDTLRLSMQIGCKL